MLYFEKEESKVEFQAFIIHTSFPRSSDFDINLHGIVHFSAEMIAVSVFHRNCHWHILWACTVTGWPWPTFLVFANKTGLRSCIISRKEIEKKLWKFPSKNALDTGFLIPCAAHDFQERFFDKFIKDFYITFSIIKG